eukprot:c12712_g1_i1.p1 GENE.c12712_g1_i1~~c12712_g1_i1.p1  ORF type:complete len:585 (+),score=124.17 c12712_g1_i1:58-1812(+)
MANTDVQPINVLIEDLKSEDIAQRLSSIKRLSTIAVALGPERTRAELVPFLNDTIDDEDEVLVALGEELGNLVKLIGGPQYATCLLLPLETLAQMEETVVRDQAVTSLKPIAEVLGPDDFSAHFIPMVKRLGTADWFTSKISATGLLPVTYKRAGSEAERDLLRGLFRDLCADDSPMVRRAASTNLAKFAEVLEKEHIESTLLPTFLRLADDEQDSVRLLAVENCVAVARIVGPEKSTASVLPTFKQCADAKSWRVRYMVADHFVSFSTSLSPEIVESDMCHLFVRLLLKDSEPEAEVRTAAARKVTSFAKLLSKESTRDFLVPAVIGLASDTSQHVRSALASVIMGLAPVCGAEDTMSKLLPLYLQLLKDDIPEVRLNIISNLQDLNNVIGMETLSQSLLPAIFELATDKQWRVRLAIIEHIPLLAEQLGVEFFEAKLAPLCFSWLGDCVFTIREAAITILKKLCTIFGLEWTQKCIIPQVVALKEHTNYLYRMTALFATQALCEVISGDILSQSLLDMVLALADDSVPNIRFNVAKTLAVTIPALGSDASVHDRIKPVLLKLSEDSDVDVKHFAGRALALVS